MTAGCAITIVGGGSIQRQVPPGLAIATGILTLAFVVSLSGCASLFPLSSGVRA